MPETLDDVVERLQEVPDLTRKRWAFPKSAALTISAGAAAGGISYALLSQFMDAAAPFAAINGLLGGLTAHSIQDYRDLRSGFKPGYGYNTLFERPEIPSLTGGAISYGLITARHLAQRGIHDISWETPLLLAPLFSAAAGAAVYSSLAGIGHILHTDSMRTLWNRMQFWKNNTQRTETLLSMPHSGEKQASLEISLAESLYEQSPAYAAHHYINAIKAHSGAQPGGISDFLHGNPNWSFRKFTRTDAFTSHIRASAQEYISGDFAMAEQYMFLATGIPHPIARLPLRAYAQVMDGIATHERDPLKRAMLLDRSIDAMRGYTYLIADIDTSDPASTVRWQLMGESRNEVFMATSTDWDLAGDIFVKRSESLASLQHEYDTTLVFHNHFARRVSRPILLMSQEPYHYLITETAGDETLYDLVRDGRHTSQVFTDASRLLANIHAFGSEQTAAGVLDGERPTERNASYFSDRIVSVLQQQLEHYGDVSLPAHFWTDLVDSYSPNNDHLITAADYMYYKDANLRNFIVGDKITAIDFELSRVLPSQLDLVSLLEFHLDYLTAKQRRSSVDAYLDERGRIRGSTFSKEERAQFFETYESAAVQRHLEWVGYCERDASLGGSREENKSAQTYHLSMAIEHLDNINYQRQFDNLRQHLTALEEALSGAIPESQIVHTIDEHLSSWPVRLGVSAAMVSLAGLVVLGSVAIQNRQIPLFDRPLITPHQDVVYIESTEMQERGQDLKNYRLIAFDKTGEQQEISEISRPDFEISPLGDKVLYITKRGIERFDLLTEQKEILRQSLSVREIALSENGSGVVYTSTGTGLDPALYRLDPKIRDRFYQIADLARDIRWSPDNVTVSYVTGDFFQGYGLHSVQSLELKGNAQFLGEHVLPIHSWSPEGSHIAYVHGTGSETEIYVADKNLQDIRSVTVFPNPVVDLVWAAHDTLVVAHSEPDGTHTLTKVSLEHATLINIHNGPPIAMSKSGTHLVYTCDGNICIYEASSGGESSRRVPGDAIDVATSGPDIVFLSQQGSLMNVGILDQHGSYRMITDNRNHSVSFEIK